MTSLVCYDVDSGSDNDGDIPEVIATIKVEPDVYMVASVNNSRRKPVRKIKKKSKPVRMLPTNKIVSRLLQDLISCVAGEKEYTAPIFELDLRKSTAESSDEGSGDSSCDELIGTSESDDSDSSTTDSTSDSSSDSSESNVFARIVNTCKTRPLQATVRKVNDQLQLDQMLDRELLPLMGGLQIAEVPPTVKLVEMGFISKIIGINVTIISNSRAIAMDIGSSLFLESRIIFGRVAEIFGPVVRPMYLVRFAKPEDLEAKNVATGTNLYCAEGNNDLTVPIFTTALMSKKYTDASWEDDGEVPDEYKDFSDDEEEKRYLVKHRNKPVQNGMDNESNPKRFHPENGTAGPSQRGRGNSRGRRGRGRGARGRGIQRGGGAIQNVTFAPSKFAPNLNSRPPRPAHNPQSHYVHGGAFGQAPVFSGFRRTGFAVPSTNQQSWHDKWIYNISNPPPPPNF